VGCVPVCGWLKGGSTVTVAFKERDQPKDSTVITKIPVTFAAAPSREENAEKSAE